ncbi:hypothetical protein LINGRAHAP2_LOCUS5067 [Linum grandiflorum]
MLSFVLKTCLGYHIHRYLLRRA